MQRRVVLEAVGHEAPSSAKKRSDGLHDLAYDLNTVFHHGFVELHDRPPKKGTNPLLEEYAPLLAHGTDELRWAGRGFASGDLKASESHRLGRIFGRAYLSEHGYTWFPDIEELIRRPERGWSTARLQDGDMPDWLVGGGNQVAVAEAKGTHAAIGKWSSDLAKRWRPQVKNVVLRRNGKKVALTKTWIIATRWVTEEQRRTLPKQYAEDPDTRDGQPVGRDDEPSLLTWLARVHTLKGLSRLRQHRVAARVAASAQARESIPRANPVTWTCMAPGLEGLSFIGRALDGHAETMCGLISPFLWEWSVFRFPDPRIPRTWLRTFEALMDDLIESTWFDGLALPIVKALVRDEAPQPLERQPVERATRAPVDVVSLLPDGSLLAPLSLMKPGERAEI